MKGFTLTDEAQRDLDSIAEYIAIEASVERAMKVLVNIRQEFRKLGEMPGIGHFREELLGREFKFWSVYSYVIVYRWQSDPITIVAVIHGARDLDTVLSTRII